MISPFLKRILFLESIAGVPGMVAATLRHLRSLRLMVCPIPANLVYFFSPSSTPEPWSASRFRLDPYAPRGSRERAHASHVSYQPPFLTFCSRNDTKPSQDLSDLTKSRCPSPRPCPRHARCLLQRL